MHLACSAALAGHLPCTAFRVYTLHAVPLSWVPSHAVQLSQGTCQEQLSQSPHSSLSWYTLHAVQLSRGTLNTLHEALVRHFAKQLSHSTRPSQQVALHECLVGHLTMQLSWSTDTSQQVSLHVWLVGHFTMQVSRSTDTSQQVPLHEALVGHFTMQLSQSNDTSQQVALLLGTSQSNSHTALIHLSNWHCM